MSLSSPTPTAPRLRDGDAAADATAAQRAARLHLRDLAREHGEAGRWPSHAIAASLYAPAPFRPPLAFSPMGSHGSLCAEAAGPMA